MVAAKVNAKHAARAKAQRVHRATVQPPHAAMARQVRLVLKVRAMVAVKVDARVAVVKSNAAIHVSTTAAMAKVVPHHAAHAMTAVDLGAAHKVDKAGRTATATTVTSCRATLTLLKPRNLRDWTCPTASPCAAAASLTRHAPASTAWPAAAAVVVAAVMAAATGVATAVVAEVVASVADQPPST